MSTSISFDEMYTRPPPETIIDDAIINIMAGDERSWNSVKFMDVPEGITTENARLSLMKPDINTSITNQNDRLTIEHAENIKMYKSMTNVGQKRSLLKTYQTRLNKITENRIHLIDIATGGKSDEVNDKLKSLFFLDKIYKWIDEIEKLIRDLPKEGGRRRKHTRRRVSKLRNKKTLRNIRRRR